jgi:hypothetical protein
MCIEQVLVDLVDIGLDAGAGPRRRDAEFLADGRQELHGGQPRIEDEGYVAVLRDLLQQAAADRGLARADLASEQDEAAFAIDAVEEMGQSLPVPIAHVEITGIGGNGKWDIRQTKIFLVHANRP